ncbi:SPRY domain-containing SOCS box protein 3-like [Elysia marginata]|uniref:SPRY domain-containing SOCS box protein 3 n=1 Tax=Elysia marginata TaxID=1093978 RepID=A0AAV4EG13_9GAST|nr:SPRY domain-containing SOCS box protein 3-like [Elysia marginata]
MPCQERVRPVYTDFIQDAWVWDDQLKPEEVQLSTDHKEAYFHVDPVSQSTGTVGVRGSKGFYEGEHYWEVVFLEPPYGSSMMVGVGTDDVVLQSEPYQYSNLIGQDNESWGLSYKGTIWHAGEGRKYCEPFYAQDTVIGVHLDLSLGQLTFYKDGVCLGPAFTGLRASRHRRLYPMVCSSATETELGLGAMYYRVGQPSRLQGECLEKIRSSLVSVDGVDSLPLPSVMKNYLRKM